MIELIVEERCTSCNACVDVCPMNVFSKTNSGLPVIARKLDCQTCYMCELYCQPDALFVASNADRPEKIDEQTVIASGLLGQYRRDSGWDEWAADPKYRNQQWYMREVFRRAATE